MVRSWSDRWALLVWTVATLGCLLMGGPLGFTVGAVCGLVTLYGWAKPGTLVFAF
ncbi:MAG: hypothetical protein ACPHID_05305 [Thermoplasmatota archaeon]